MGEQAVTAHTRVALSHELADFLIDLSSAFQKHSMYPPGHPTLAPAVDLVLLRLSVLLGIRQTLVIAVARDQLIIEGAATDRQHPLLRGLADRLSRHELGVVTFTDGVTESEIADFLAELAMEPERTGQPLGQAEDLNVGRPHIRLHPMGYDRLQIREEGGSSDDSVVPASRLWILLAEAALGDGDARRSAADPAAVARAIDERTGDDAYDKVIAGYLQTITREIDDGSAAGSTDLSSRVSGLISRLEPAALQRLLHSMATNTGQQHQFLTSAARQLSAEAVLDLLEAASEESTRDISDSMMRVLTKLSRHASTDGESRCEADDALREQVQRLIADWNLENPNAEDYDLALQSMSAGAPLVRQQKRTTSDSDPERIVKMSLELEADGDTLRCAVDELIGRNSVGMLLEFLDDAPPGNDAAEQVWRQLARPTTLRQIAASESPNFDWIDRLLPIMGHNAADPLLDALSESTSRSTRWKLLARLAGLGPEIGPNLVARLDDKRWYVVRNMLSLMGTLPSWPTDFRPAALAQHEHEMVRLEALKLCMKQPQLRDIAVVEALSDGRDRLTTLGVAEAEVSFPQAAFPHLVRLSLDSGLESRIRVPAIRCLARSRSPQALQTLLQIAPVKRRVLRRNKLPPRSPELVAALSSLRIGWSDESAAQRALATALRSGDPELREAAVHTKAGQ